MKKGILIVLMALVALGFTGMNGAFANGSVEGAVINQDGEPVAGAHVMIVSAERERGVRPFHERTESGENGGFEFADVPAGNYNIVAGMRDVGGAREEIEVVDGNATQVELQLAIREGHGEDEERETGSISGVVLDVDGEAVPRAQIAVMPRFRGGRFGHGGGFDMRNLRATSDENGEFSLEEVPVGNHFIMAMGFRLGMVRAEVEVRADENTEVELQFEERGGGRGGGGDLWNGNTQMNQNR